LTWFIDSKAPIELKVKMRLASLLSIAVSFLQLANTSAIPQDKQPTATPETPLATAGSIQAAYVDIITSIGKLNSVVSALDSAADQKAGWQSIVSGGTELTGQLSKGTSTIAALAPIPEETYGSPIAASAVQATEALIQAVRAIGRRAPRLKDDANTLNAMAASLTQQRDLTVKFQETVSSKMQSSQGQAPAGTSCGMTAMGTPTRQALKEQSDRAVQALEDTIKAFKT
jgi:hypothetical protein